jgi:hypothetical protein
MSWLELAGTGADCHRESLHLASAMATTCQWFEDLLGESVDF